MKVARILLPALLSVSFLYAEAATDSSAVRVDTTAARVVQQDPAKKQLKQVNVQQPPTNWSKIKDLFM